jgi:hypothetical protein
VAAHKGGPYGRSAQLACELFGKRNFVHDFDCRNCPMIRQDCSRIYDDGRKPEGAPERSPKAGAGAPSGVDGNGPKRFSV